MESDMYDGEKLSESCPEDLMSITPSNSDTQSPPSSLPRPKFYDKHQVLSTKKERRTSLFRAPPRPPAKTCPPLSRAYKRCPDFMSPMAQVVTFRKSMNGELTSTPLNSNGVYDISKKQSYFEQMFEVEDKIGAGYFGSVYKVRHRADGNLYAIKIANDRYKGLGDRNQKLEEVRKHEVLLPHPNCVHFYHSWEEDGLLYQQFELCEMSLAELTEKKHDLPERLIWAYLVDLLLAVQHLHNNNLIHMDIKPENIFIGRDGICKLGDFGLVIDVNKEEISKNSFSNVSPGDAKYMARELLDNKYTKAADIFSLGLTILELACDLDLPTGGPLWQQLRKTGPDFRITANLSPDLRKVIHLMMGHDQNRRPTVDQLLDLPTIQNARQRRKIELAIRSVYMTGFDSILTMVNFLILTVTIAFINPFKSLLSIFEKEPDLATPVLKEEPPEPPQDTTPSFFERELDDTGELDDSLRLRSNNAMEENVSSDEKRWENLRSAIRPLNLSKKFDCYSDDDD